MWRRVYKAGGGKKIEDGGEVAEEEEERKLTKFMALHPPLKSWEEAVRYSNHYLH